MENGASCWEGFVSPMDTQHTWGWVDVMKINLGHQLLGTERQLGDSFLSI